MKRFVKVFLAGIAAVALSAGTANATTIIDFGTGFGGAGGTVTIGTNVTGSGIFIDSVTITGALLNNGTYDVDGTAACAWNGTAYTDTCGVLSFDKNSNTISLVGSIPLLNIGPINLLLGDLSGGLTVVSNSAIYASGLDAKSRELLIAIGLDPATQFGYFGFVLGFNPTGGGYTVISTDIVNTAVPEPGSIALFGTGLFGLAAAVRRRLGKKA